MSYNAFLLLVQKSVDLIFYFNLSKAPTVRPWTSHVIEFESLTELILVGTEVLNYHFM
jgi:hypothetical protein